MPESVLPPDWQARMVAMIRGAEPLEPDWFTGGPVLGPAEQIGVYRDQYRLRMWNTLVDEVPGTLALLGGVFEVVNQRILETPVAPHPNEAPFLVLIHGVFVSLAQVTDAICFLEIIEFGGVFLMLAEVEFDRALVLLSAIDEPLFTKALRLHRGAWQREGQANQQRGGKEDDREKCEPLLALRTAAGGLLRQCARRAHGPTRVTLVLRSTAASADL